MRLADLASLGSENKSGTKKTQPRNFVSSELTSFRNRKRTKKATNSVRSELTSFRNRKNTKKTTNFVRSELTSFHHLVPGTKNRANHSSNSVSLRSQLFLLVLITTAFRCVHNCFARTHHNSVSLRSTTSFLILIPRHPPGPSCNLSQVKSSKSVV